MESAEQADRPVIVALGNRQARHPIQVADHAPPVGKLGHDEQTLGVVLVGSLKVVLEPRDVTQRVERVCDSRLQARPAADR